MEHLALVDLPGDLRGPACRPARRAGKARNEAVVEHEQREVVCDQPGIEKGERLRGKFRLADRGDEVDERVVFQDRSDGSTT